MNEYEVMMVVSPDFEIDNEKKRDELLHKLLEDETIKLGKVTVLGKKALAYPVRHHREGIYVLVRAEGKMKADEVHKRARLTGDDVLRILIVREESKRH